MPIGKIPLPMSYRARPRVRNVIGLAWSIIRLPVLAVLVVFEPFVSFILSAAGFLGMLAALVLKISGDLPHSPFWGMMAASVGAVLLLMIYHLLILFLSR